MIFEESSILDQPEITNSRLFKKFDTTLTTTHLRTSLGEMFIYMKRINSFFQKECQKEFDYYAEDRIIPNHKFNYYFFNELLRSMMEYTFLTIDVSAMTEIVLRFSVTKDFEYFKEYLEKINLIEIDALDTWMDELNAVMEKF